MGLCGFIYFLSWTAKCTFDKTQDVKQSTQDSVMALHRNSNNNTKDKNQNI